MNLASRNEMSIFLFLTAQTFSLSNQNFKLIFHIEIFNNLPMLLQASGEGDGKLRVGRRAGSLKHEGEKLI